MSPTSRPTPLVVVGCGGFGREVHAIVLAINRTLGGAGLPAHWDLLGFVDDLPAEANRERAAQLGAALLGTVADLASMPIEVHAVIAVGSPRARRDIADRLPGRRLATLVHPGSTIGTQVRIGDGSIVAPGALLSTNISRGRHVHVDQGVTVGHDTTIGAASRLNPAACVSGGVTIGDEVLVGANATVLQGLNIGDGAVVGAGAVVVRDVPAGRVVKGVPAS